MQVNNRLKSIRTKLFIIGLIPVALFALLVIPSNRSSIYNEKKIMLREQINMIDSIVDHYYRMELNGYMSRYQAQREAYRIIKEIRYGEFKKDYIWINDYYPKIILHPFRPDLEGKDVSDMTDRDGLHIFKEFVKVARTDGNGYVPYYWQYYDDKNRIEPKLSFVTDFKPWGWIIGTGIYVHDVDKSVASQRTSMLIFYLIISFVSLFFILIYAQRLIKPLTAVNQVITTMASGDLSVRYDGHAKQDEVGHIAASVNHTLDNFERLITEITDAGASLSQAIQEISRGNEDLSQRTAEQAASIQEIAATVEETVNTINNSASNASDAKTIAEKTLHLAEDGGKLAEDAMKAIDDIGRSGKIIGEIIGIIEKIAFQTSLLSVNASIEAAKAGEAGRGFAVVANEVRGLARNTAESVEKISDLIGNSVSSINTGAELMTRSGQSLSQIIGSVREVSKMVESIAEFSEEQRQGIQQISTAIGQLDAMTQQNSALVEETATASEEISNQANELISMMREFKIRSMSPPPSEVRRILKPQPAVA